MPYTGPYSLATRCVTEFLGTAMAIFLGNSVITNELLPLTKGHGMGFGWVATAFGMAFGVSIMMFGYASAHVNPCMALALFVIDRLSFSDFVAIALCEIAGGFVGAVAAYIVYMPHFRTVPEPPAAGDTAHASNLLRTRDTIDPSALRLASYNTRSSPSHPPKTFAERLRDAKYYLTAENSDPEHVFKLLSLGTLDLAGVEVAFPPENDIENAGAGGTDNATRADTMATIDASGTTAAARSPRVIQRRHSIQVSEMQRRLRQLEKTIHGEDGQSLRSDEDTPVPHGSALPQPQAPAASGGKDAVGNIVVMRRGSAGSLTHRQAIDAIHRAAVMADQAAKLSCFCNRPAIYLPPHNMAVELIGTTVLVLGALLLDDRFATLKSLVGAETAALVFETGLAPFFVACFIQICIMSLGGPTGFTANPARDLGPRFAHWILPIPGKGKSEWNFSAFINVACLLGGVCAGGLFLAIKRVHNGI
ncbi:hypothetical protein HK105_205271 [Polyrhizophydium stewartii]|uniref:Uncharacterized protein n=1 Tax=Polyrhizophydium stewartii TaxID=2732419 RepID=A0ABR4N6N8_9FUNG|nr:hypothetical protein HK105_001371 [Polyrhizophydium stewartii]